MLNCGPDPEHDVLLAIYSRDISGNMTRVERVWCDTWEVIEPTWLQRPIFPKRRICVPQCSLAGAKSMFSERYCHYKEATGSALERFKGPKFDQYNCSEAGCIEQSSNTQRNYEALVHSARDGDLAIIRHLIVEHKLGDSMKGSVGWFALWAAPSAQHTAVVWFLMSMAEVVINGEFEDPKTKHRFTLMCTAVAKGDTDLVWLLLSRSDIKTDFGELAPPPVKLAIKHKWHDIFWMFMAHEGFRRSISRHIDELKSDSIDLADQFFYGALGNKLDSSME